MEVENEPIVKEASLKSEGISNFQDCWRKSSGILKDWFIHQS